MLKYSFNHTIVGYSLIHYRNSLLPFVPSYKLFIAITIIIKLFPAFRLMRICWNEWSLSWRPELIARALAMSTGNPQAESVIRNIIREICLECSSQGQNVTETLAAFMVSLGEIYSA